MYCKKCGKFIGNDADLCDECMAQEETAFGEFSTQKEEPYGSPAPTYYQTSEYSGQEISLGKPITAIILSNIGFVLLYIALLVMGELAIYEATEYGIVVAFWLIGVSLSIVGLILGIQSIKYFRATSMIKSGKRIPVLILGIVSVVIAGVGLFLASIMMLLLALL